MRGAAAAGAFIGVLLLLVLLAAILPGAPALPATPPGPAGVGTALWGGRAAEVLLQGFILLAGSTGVLLLLGSRAPREGSP